MNEPLTSHMCRDGHPIIRHNDSENERCPLCVALSQRDEARAKLAVAECMVDSLGHPVKSPCGHCSSLSWTDDGGKHIRCLLCSEAKARARVAVLEAQVALASEALKLSGHLCGCAWETNRDPHCEHCGKTEERHHRYTEGHCPDERGRPEPTKWSPRPARDCNCGRDAALAAISADPLKVGEALKEGKWAGQ